MRTGRSYVATAVALGIITLSGCAADVADETSNKGGVGSEDWGDQNKYPEIGGKFASLLPIVGSCVFANGVATVTFTNATTVAQTVVIGKRAVDSAILVNGATCDTAAVPPVSATASLLKRLVVTGGAGDDTLILDFLGGLLAPGVSSATSGGIAIDLGTGTNDVRIRGTSNVDAFVFGNDGLAFNADNFKDVTFANVPTVSIALAGGNDTFTGTNAVANHGVTGNTTLALTVFGGDGADVLTGGDGADAVRGGPGADTLNGGLGIDTVFGDEGADVLAQGLVADGADALDCGSDPITVAAPVDVSIDTVSYAQRTVLVTATIGGSGTSGDVDTIAANCEGLVGTALNDVLIGDSGNNVLSGGLGNDTLQGMAGDDILNGNDGDDLFTEEGTTTDNGSDVFNGGPGSDTVSYATRTVKVTATMDGTDNDDGIDAELDNIKADVENLIGGTAGDDISGNPSGNTLTGGLGNDVLRGLAGDDTFAEGLVTNGDDTFIGGGGLHDMVDYHLRSVALTITMGADDTNVPDGVSGEADDVQDDIEDCLGGSAIDNITGNDSNNDIRGGAGLDVIEGGAGDDYLDGEAGNATITCGSGSDVALDFAGSRDATCET